MKHYARKILLLGICCCQITVAAAAPGNTQLAACWAPSVDQFYKMAGNASQTNPAQEDTSTVFNFDLDWRANNNWENLNYYKLKPPVVYYSLVETEKFAYIGYYFYYPRHLGANPHANDFSGLLAMVEKVPGSTTGRLAGVLLHNATGWREVGAGEVAALNPPLQVSISAGDHFLSLGADQELASNVLSFQPPKYVNNAFVEGDAACYRLVSLEEVWQHRSEIQAGEAYGTLSTTGMGTTELKTLPWNWQHKGVRWLSDPAGLFRLFKGGKTPAGAYVYNPYAG
ncbi:MAG TPA: hypothetical protein VN462_06385 [Negativicutes bacterium]|nr:hypothetical protein [Negativicutes bacterium]